MWLSTSHTVVVVRVLGPDGLYPDYTIETAQHLYIPSQDGPWIAAIQPPIPDDWERGEVTALAPEEVRLLSALTLSESDPWSHGRPIITHWVESSLELSGESDLREKELRRQVEQMAVNLTTKTPRPTPRFDFDFPPGSFRITDVGSADEAAALLQSIDASDQLLLAGLGRLLGGSRLIFAAGEMEEGALSLFVSMNAGLEFIRQYLCEQRGADASFADVHSYLASVYPEGSRITELYEYMYEHRLAATHPANRLGEFWAPPLMADDVYHLQKNLIVLYRHIILGALPEFDW